MQWTKDVRSKTAPAYTAANRHQRSITESVRAFPYGRALWRPPGFELHFKPEEALLAGKKSADALEALIGVVFEAAGEDATEAWLAWLGVLPNHKGVRENSHAWLACIVCRSTRLRVWRCNQSVEELHVEIRGYDLRCHSNRTRDPHA